MDLGSDYGIPRWASLFVGGLILITVYLNIRFGYWRRRGIVSLTFWDYLKNVYDVTRKPIHEILFEQYKKFGRIHGLSAGKVRQITIADPTLLKQILVKDFHVFPNRVKFEVGESIFKNMLSVLQDEDWKRVRCIVSPTFTSSRMRKMAHLVKEGAENFAKYCEKAAERNEEIDCKKYYNTFAIEIIALTAFGTKLNSFENPDHPFIKNAKFMFSSDNVLFVVIKMLCPWIFRFIKADSFFGDVSTYFRDFALHVINERDKNNIRANDFLQLMIDAQRGKLEKEEDDEKEGGDEPQILPKNRTMSLDEVISQCVLFFIAAGETISTTLAFFSYHLALHPDYQRTLISEIDEVWERNGEMNYDVLGQLTYLDAVLCEVLRVHPVAHQLLRIAAEDYKLGDTGVVLEKGTIVSVPVHSMHNDPEFFREPNIFDPERFMPENRKSILPFSYLPFGDGPRHCIGMRFAMMELKLCAAHLLRRVKIEATEGTKKPLRYYKGQSLMQPKEIMVRLVKRQL